MKKNVGFLTLIFGIVIFLSTSCKKDEIIDEDSTLPLLTTLDVYDIALTSANCGGNVSSDGGSTVTARGVCWSIEQNPTINNNNTTNGSGIGDFSSIVEGLTANTTYYIRAYATNNKGTAYGNEISFKTNPLITPQFNVLKVIDGKEIRNIIKTSDGGYIGIVNSQDFDIIKFDSEFNTVWNKIYGGSDGDYVESIIQTNDGGYVVIGGTKSNDGEVTINHGGYDIWICRLDTEGNLVWERSYGGSEGEGVSKENSLMQTNDGGYIFIGHTESNNGDISLNHGGYDAWLVKINSIGDIEFEKTYGGSENDFGRKIIETNMNYSISIKVGSSDGDFNAPGNWVVQIDENKDILWKTNLHGMNSGFINTTVDNEIIVVNTSANEFLLSKLDFSGVVLMDNSINFQSLSSKQPHAVKIMQNSDKGFIVTGTLGNGNDADAVLFRLTPELNLLYYKIYTGNDLDMSASLIPLNNADYIYQFFTSSTDLEDIQHSSWMSSAIIKLEELVD
ncbi:hypothetical protein [Marinifilum fragile]|uniref:hypothetical protein n=1 Tax=Marinifilum fragile TaxID=570161 RepID=UPI002AA6651D|nr:hypothetical protein [Marinifilum fragile]